MEKEKIIAVLLILAILFSVASVVFNLNFGELKQKSGAPSGHSIAGNLNGGIKLTVEQRPEGAGK